MNATAIPNVIPLTQPVVAPKPGHKSRFAIKPYTNPRTGTKSWRVIGMKRDRTRIRENFAEVAAAECRQVELTTEWLARQTDTAIRATKLTDVQIRLAETAFIRLDSDEDLLLAVEHWKNHGKAVAVAESPRLDDAVEDFFKWLKQTDSIRQRTKDKHRVRINVFRNSLSNLRVADVTADTIESFLAKRDVSALTKIGDRNSASVFFKWCMSSPRKWAKVNPCSGVVIVKPADTNPIQVLSVEDCAKLLKVARSHRKGRLLPYVAVCLFAGLRPAEAQRLTWDKVNLDDGEIRIESQSSKRKRGRTVKIDGALKAWLSICRKKPFNPPNFRKDLDILKERCGYSGRAGEENSELKPWPADVMRHTAISHYFRKTGSYGQTAEQFGNSEAIIKNHYQGRVNSEDTKKFYAIKPAKSRK